MRSLIPLLTVSIFLFSISPAAAQIGAATITGRVMDPTGAMVPNVNVLIVNTETNFQFSTATNSEGLFRVQSLQPGRYRINFEAAGFKRLVRENVELRTGDTLPVDVSLEVGTVAESVEIKASVPLLETETSATGTVVEGNFLYKMPLYQRWVNAALFLVPGMTEGGYAGPYTLSAFHIAGQRNGAIGFFEDGVIANDQTTGLKASEPIQNSLEEVKVLTTALPAEYGHSAGGVISAVKKTGTNDLHGLASNYGRTRRMQHRRFFDMNRTSQATATAPNGTQNFFMLPDANVGGPVVIPKLYNGRNRTFFFFSYQKFIEKKVQQNVGTVPTAAMLGGDLSFGGLGNPLYDPTTTRQLANGSWTRDPIPGSRIPLSRIDPVAQKIINIHPWKYPNLPGSFNTTGPVSNLIFDRPSRCFYDNYGGRVDQQFSSKFKIYGSYTYNHENCWGEALSIQNNDLGRPFDPNGGPRTPFTQQNYSVGGAWIINPATINDTRVGYFRNRTDKFVPSFGQNYGQILGIPNISAELLPSFGSGDTYSPDSIYGLTVSGPSRQIGETISLRNDLTKILGTHAFKMGYEVLRHRLNSTSTNRPSGDFRFDAMTAGLQADGNTMPRTGNTFAGFLLGSVRQAQFDQELASWLPRSYIHSFYFQDDWKFSPTLTLNLGIRYSNESPFHTKYGQMSNFSPAGIDDVAAGKVGAIAHPKSGLNQRDNNNFQPRIGAAWHPLRKWVFRGGFAVNIVDVKYPSARGQFEEYVAQTNQQRVPGDPRPLYQISRGPDSVAYNIRANGTSGFLGTNYSARSDEWWDPNLRNPYVLNFNISTQYEINPSYVVEVMYQGSAGVGLIERWQANTFPIDYAKNDPTLRAAVFAAAQNYRPFPQFGDVVFRSNLGHSTYHSGTVKLEKRFSRGMTFITFYTFSKAIDSQDTDNSGSGVAPIQNRSLEKARAGFDRTHRLMGEITYELPFGKDRKFLNRGGAWNFILGGYEIAWIQAFESGNPLNFGFSNSPYNYYPTFAGARRPNVAGKPKVRDNWSDFGGDRFNTNNINPVMDINYFAYPATFTPGNLGRNVVTGLPMRWSTVSAKKNFRVSERFNLQVRWDFQNALKTFNFQAPTTSVDLLNPRTFGKVSADPLTSYFGGQPLMNLTLQLTW